MVRTRIFHAFASSFKEQQFLELKRQLLERGEDCLLLGNYNIGRRIDYDAIIVTPSDIYVVEFKESHQAGVITINDDGWTYADGTVVWSGNHADTVFEQMRFKRNCLYGHLRKHADGQLFLFIKTLVVFSKPFSLEKGHTVLCDVQENKHGWLFLDTPECMADTLFDHASKFKTEGLQWFETVASCFGMKLPWWQRIIAKLLHPQKILWEKLLSECRIKPRTLLTVNNPIN